MVQILEGPDPKRLLLLALRTMVLLHKQTPTGSLEEADFWTQITQTQAPQLITAEQRAEPQVTYILQHRSLQKHPLAYLRIMLLSKCYTSPSSPC